MIKYVHGDLFEGIKGKTNILIPHIVNNIGVFGGGFTAPLAKHFPQAREQYLKWYTQYGLGRCQFINIDIGYVMNMYGQHNVGRNSDGRPPIRYAALASAMNTIHQLYFKNKYTIHTVKFGSGLACGNWDFIETLINEIWHDFDVTIYYL